MGIRNTHDDVLCGRMSDEWLECIGHCVSFRVRSDQFNAERRRRHSRRGVRECVLAWEEVNGIAIVEHMGIISSVFAAHFTIGRKLASLERLPESGP